MTRPAPADDQPDEPFLAEQITEALVALAGADDSTRAAVASGHRLLTNTDD